MTPEQLNEDLGRRLGRNPLGQPLYAWMHSERFTHLMKVEGETEVVERNGLFLVEPVYRHRKMCPELEDTWILAHWHEPISQFAWEQQYGSSLLWPREGYYSPTNILLSPGEAPTQTSNDQSVYLIRKQSEKTMADHLADGERIVERKETRQKNVVSDRIDDSIPAFCNIPGTRSAHVSFPSTATERQK